MTALPETASSGILAAHNVQWADGADSPERVATPAGAVFLSYASEDADAAERLATNLGTLRVPSSSPLDVSGAA